MISVIIPAFNSEKYIVDTLRSVVNQTYKNFEIILINDGSTDKTEINIKKFIDSTKSIKIHLINQKHKGPSAARNRGLKKAKGAYIQFFDADDLMHPNKLKISLNLIKKANADAIITDFGRFANNKNLKKIINKNYRKQLKYLHKDSKTLNLSQLIIKYGFGAPRILYKKYILLKNRGFNENLVINEDHELNYRLLKNKCRFVYMPLVLMYYRMGSSNMQFLKNQDKARKIMNSVNVMFSTINNYEDNDLKKFAKHILANKIENLACELFRSEFYKEGNLLTKKAKSLSDQKLIISNRWYLNLTNRIFGLGTLDKIYSKFKRINP